MAPKLYRSARAFVCGEPATSSGAEYKLPRTAATAGTGIGNMSVSSAITACVVGVTSTISGRIPSRIAPAECN